MGVNSVLKYGQYTGTVECDLDAKVLHGKIEYIDDLVTYEAKTIEELEEEFRLAVEDYIAACEALGEKPNKPLSGTFNIRIGPERHKRLSVLAKRNGTKMNEEVVKAVDSHLSKDKGEVHLHYHVAREEKLSLGESWSKYEITENAKH